MDVLSVLSLFCGLALFLYGMNTMGDGLESFSGGKLEKILEKKEFSVDSKNILLSMIYKIWLKYDAKENNNSQTEK